MPTPKTALLCCLLAIPLDAQRGRESRRAPKLEHGVFEIERFESEAIDGKAEYGIYLPNGYHDEANAERRYPLVIWLHGLNEDHQRFHRRGGAAVLDEMVGAEDFPQAIFVTPNGGRSFYINGGDAKRYEDLITVDLMEHIERTYRVAAKRSQRALMGVSMGGYGALKIALRHPQLFGVVAAHSAAILPRDPSTLEDKFPWLKRWGGAQRLARSLFGDPLDQERWDAENVLAIGDGLDRAELAGMKIYIDCGDEDRYGFAEPNGELHEILSEKKISHTWRLVEGGDHGWRSNYNQRALPHSLKFVAAAWAAGKGTSGLEGLFRRGDPDETGRGSGKNLRR